MLPAPPPPGDVRPAVHEVRISPAEAAARGLPPIGVRLESSGFMVDLPADGSAWVRLHGPPGGTLMAIVAPLAGGSAALEDSVRAWEKRPVTFGRTGRVAVGGAALDARLWWAGEKSAATAGCVAALPAGDRALLILFAVPGTPASVTTCEAVASHPSIRRFLDSLRIEHPPR